MNGKSWRLVVKLRLVFGIRTGCYVADFQAVKPTAGGLFLDVLTKPFETRLDLFGRIHHLRAVVDHVRSKENY